MPTFSAAGYMGMLAATLSSIFESVGDYFAASRFSEAPVPPPHAINRGIFIEGFASIISGLMGAGHATTSYSGNIGIIGITKVSILIKFNALTKSESVWDDLTPCFLSFKQLVLLFIPLDS